jgi:hypothetical protein
MKLVHTFVLSLQQSGGNNKLNTMKLITKKEIRNNTVKVGLEYVAVIKPFEFYQFKYKSDITKNQKLSFIRIYEKSHFGLMYAGELSLMSATKETFVSAVYEFLNKSL